MRGNELLDKTGTDRPHLHRSGGHRAEQAEKRLGEVGNAGSLPLPGLRAGRPRHGGLQSGIL